MDTQSERERSSGTMSDGNFHEKQVVIGQEF